MQTTFGEAKKHATQWRQDTSVSNQRVRYSVLHESQSSSPFPQLDFLLQVEYLIPDELGQGPFNVECIVSSTNGETKYAVGTGEVGMKSRNN